MSYPTAVEPPNQAPRNDPHIRTAHRAGIWVSGSIRGCPAPPGTRSDSIHFLRLRRTPGPRTPGPRTPGPPDPEHDVSLGTTVPDSPKPELNPVGSTALNQPAGSAHNTVPPAPPGADAPALGPRGLAVLVALSALVLLGVGTYQAVRSWPVDRTVKGLDRPLPLPAMWQPLEPAPPGPAAVFIRKSMTAFRPVLVVNILPAQAAAVDAGAEPTGGAGAGGPGPAATTGGPNGSEYAGGPGAATPPVDPGRDVEERFRAWLPVAPKQFPGFEILNGPSSWDRCARGARAVTFSFRRPAPGGVEQPTTAVLALAPLPGGRALSLLLLCDPADLDPRRWDLRLVMSGRTVNN
jgi:hypothetical protein